MDGNNMGRGIEEIGKGGRGKPRKEGRREGHLGRVIEEGWVVVCWTAGEKQVIR